VPWEDGGGGGAWGKAQLRDENEDEDQTETVWKCGGVSFLGSLGVPRRHTIAIDISQEEEEESPETRRKMGDLGVGMRSTEPQTCISCLRFSRCISV